MLRPHTLDGGALMRRKRHQRAFDKRNLGAHRDIAVQTFPHTTKTDRKRVDSARPDQLQRVIPVAGLRHLERGMQPVTLLRQLGGFADRQLSAVMLNKQAELMTKSLTAAGRGIRPEPLPPITFTISLFFIAKKTAVVVAPQQYPHEKIVGYSERVQTKTWSVVRRAAFSRPSSHSRCPATVLALIVAAGVAGRQWVWWVRPSCCFAHDGAPTLGC